MKVNFAKLIKKLGKTANDHSPAILTAMGIGGFGASIVMTGTATVRAMHLIKEKHIDTSEKTEVVKETWTYFIPPALTYILSGVCVIGAHKIHVRRAAALTTTVEITKSALKDLKESTKEIIGEKKYKDIQDRTAQKKIEHNPVTESNTVLIEGKGETWCFDVVTSQYFKSDLAKIRTAQNQLNYRLTVGMEEYITFNEWAAEIGIKTIRTGDDIGWGIYTTGMIEIVPGAQIMEDGTPCIVIDYTDLPQDIHGNSYF